MEKLGADNRFAIVPEWVIALDISHTAFRLYAVLARYADNITHQAFPARATLAQRLQCSEKTVDRAVEDLVAHGAIHKQSRGRYASALYTVMTAAPGETKMSTEQTEMSSEQTDLSFRSDKNDHLTRTTELEPDNYIEKKAKRATSSRWMRLWIFIRLRDLCSKVGMRRLGLGVGTR
jgi:DNA-binding transcriptional regulator YhcF (GntR family)